jgi:glucoamylase
MAGRIILKGFALAWSLQGFVNAQNPIPYATPTGFSDDITAYFSPSNVSRVYTAKTLMFANINVPGSANGTVIAAQSYSNPNYAYHWVRDASLTMDVVQSLYAAATSQTAKDHYSQILFAYAGARSTEQTDPGLQTGLGEPKFNLDNSVFTGPWGRPQNDGPATTAITLMEFATAYLTNGGSIEAVKNSIYQEPVKTDLLFVASNWSSSSFDIWEEESSFHFYNRVVSHKALSMGSSFADKMGDSTTSATLSSAASAVAQTLSQFWDPDRGIILYEQGPVLRDKSSYQDISVILGVIHGYNNDGVYSYSNDEVLSTAYKLSMSFLDTYPISSQHADFNGATLGIPIG